MTQDVAVMSPISKIERVLIQGDLAPLTPDERVLYYNRVCESIGVNPMTKPFEYITLNGKLTLYARKDCTDQLRARDKVSIHDLKSQQVGDVYIVTALARNEAGREDAATGAVSIKGKFGDDLANAMMKAETKAKRRVTLSICGLGMLDETELETIKEEPHVSHGNGAPALPSPSGPYMFTVGKHKGKSIDDPTIDEGYLRWMAENMKDATAREAASVELQRRAAVRPSDTEGMTQGEALWLDWKGYMNDDPDRAAVLKQTMKKLGFPSLELDEPTQRTFIHACQSAMDAANIQYEGAL